MPATKLKFTRPRKKNSTGIRPNAKERKKVYNSTYNDNHKSEINLRLKIKRKNSRIKQLQKQNIINSNIVDNHNNSYSESVGILQQEIKMLDNENKYLENKTCELEEQIQEIEQYPNKIDDSKNIVNSFLDLFSKELFEIIKLLSKKKLRYNMSIMILFINLRKYCASSNIVSMVMDVIDIVKEFIRLFFGYVSDSWGVILSFIIESLKQLIPKTTTVKKWCTYRMDKITRMHSALHLYNLSNSDNKMVYHADGSSIQNVSFEGFGICTRDINNKINYEMVSDYEIFQSFLCKQNKSNQILLPKFNDHILSICEVL